MITITLCSHLGQCLKIFLKSTVSEGDWWLSTHANPTSTRRALIRPIGLLGEQSSPKWKIPCPGHPRTTVQNLMPLALSLLEKSVTIQTNKQKNKQTVTDISTPCLSECVDKTSCEPTELRVWARRTHSGNAVSFSGLWRPSVDVEAFATTTACCDLDLYLLTFRI